MPKLLTAVCLLLPFAILRAGDASAESALRRIYSEYDRSVAAGAPTAVLSRVAAPDFVSISADGSRQSLSQLMAAIQQSFEKTPKSAQISASTRIEKITLRASGAEAGVLGKTHIEITFPDPNSGALTASITDQTFENTWTQTPSGWKLKLVRQLTAKNRTTTSPVP